MGGGGGGGGLIFETNCIFEYKPSPHFRLDVVYKMGGHINGHYGIMKIELMHLVGDREGLLPECSAGYLKLRRLKLMHTWHLTACLLQIINGRLPTGSTNFDHDSV